MIDSKKDYEYLIFENMKAAGFEPLEVCSGYTDNKMGAYVECRDQKAAFLVQRLARGKHSISYRLRAEIPGKLSALPTRAYAMYAPELKANSDEIKLIVKDNKKVSGLSKKFDTAGNNSVLQLNAADLILDNGKLINLSYVGRCATLCRAITLYVILTYERLVNVNA